LEKRGTLSSKGSGRSLEGAVRRSPAEHDYKRGRHEYEGSNTLWGESVTPQKIQIGKKSILGKRSAREKSTPAKRVIKRTMFSNAGRENSTIRKKKPIRKQKAYKNVLLLYGEPIGEVLRSCTAREKASTKSVPSGCENRRGEEIRGEVEIDRTDRGKSPEKEGSTEAQKEF